MLSSVLRLRLTPAIQRAGILRTSRGHLAFPHHSRSLSCTFPRREAKIPEVSAVPPIPASEKTSISESLLSSAIPTPVDESSVEDVFSLPEHNSTVYLDNLYPIRLHWLDPRFLFLPNRLAQFILRSAQDAYIPSHLPHGARITSIVPRFKDGGAFLNIRYYARSGSKAETEIIDLIQAHLVKSPRRWFNFQRNAAFLVEGKPFIADMSGRNPYRAIKVELRGADYNVPAPIELIYERMSKFGVIYDIITPVPAKDIPRHVRVIFNNRRHAATALNCIYGARVHLDESGQTAILRISYERTKNLIELILDYISSHPKVFLPLIAAALIALTYSIFDPIRRAFIRYRTHEFDVADMLFGKWGKSFKGWWTQRKAKTSSRQLSLWEDYDELDEKLRLWVSEAPSTFITVTGPSGSGKTELVDKILAERHWKLIIDCDPLITAKGEDDMINKLAAQLGYKPVFGLVRKLTNLLDASITATTGAQAGLSDSVHDQTQRILECVAVALDGIDSNHTIDEFESAKGSRLSLTSQEIAESSQREQYPVVVINAFHSREGKQFEQLWEDIADWAALLIENRVAHVIFVGKNSASLVRPLGRVMPNQAFNSISMRDGSPDTAVSYTQKRLADVNAKIPDAEILPCVEALGGRLVDLEQLVQRILAGQTPKEALEDLVERAAAEIRKTALGEDGDVTGGWRPSQFWSIASLLATNDFVSYDSFRESPLFNSAADAGDKLEAFERADLVQIIVHNSRPFAIAPGKPLHRAAFRLMMEDPNFVAHMEVQRLGELLKVEQAKVDKYEAELERVNALYTGIGTARVGAERTVRESLDDRVRSLAKRLSASGAKVDALVEDIKKAKAVNSKQGMSIDEARLHDVHINMN